MLIEEILRGTAQAAPAAGNMITTASDTEWRKFLDQIDSVEEVIRKEIEQEGENNLLLADKQRAERRENWQEQWEKFLANAKLACREIPREAESSHSLLVQKLHQEKDITENTPAPDAAGQMERLLADKEKTEAFDRQSRIPYSEYMKDGAIVYNGVTFQHGDGFLALGDVSNPANVLTIPLAGGGSLFSQPKLHRTVRQSYGHVFCRGFW